METSAATPPDVRTSWVDDIAEAAAAGLVTAPRAWTAALLVLVLLLGDGGSLPVTALQVAAAFLAAGLLRRRIPKDLTFSIWLLPGVAVALLLFAATSGSPAADLGVRVFGRLAGVLLAAIGVWRGRRLHAGIAGPLLALAVVAERTRGADLGLPTGARAVVDALAWPLALAAVGLTLWPPAGGFRSDPPRRPSKAVPAWAIWWFVPGVLAFAPTSSHQVSGVAWLPGLEATTVAYVAARVASRLSPDRTPDPDRAVAGLAAAARRAPWMTSCAVVMTAVVWSFACRTIATALTGVCAVVSGNAIRTTAADAPFDAFVVAILAHGAFRALRGRARAAPWGAVLAIPVSILAAPLAVVVLAENDAIGWSVFAIGPAVALLPLATGHLAPRRAARSPILPLAFLVLALAATFACPRTTMDPMTAVLQVAVWPIPVLLAFHVLVRSPTRGRTRCIGATAMAVATFATVAIVRGPTQHAWDSTAWNAPEPSQFAFVLPMGIVVVTWLLALIPLELARAFHREEVARAGGVRPDAGAVG